MNETQFAGLVWSVWWQSDALLRVNFSHWHCETESVFARAADFTNSQLPLLLSLTEPNTHTGKQLWRSGFVITPVQFNWRDKSVTLSAVETDSPLICLFGWSALDRGAMFFFFPSPQLFSFTATMQMYSLQVCTARLHVPFSCVGHWNPSRK